MKLHWSRTKEPRASWVDSSFARDVNLGLAFYTSLVDSPRSLRGRPGEEVDSRFARDVNLGLAC